MHRRTKSTLPIPYSPDLHVGPPFRHSERPFMSRGWACPTPRSAPGCSSVRARSSTTWARASPSAPSAPEGNSTTSCPDPDTASPH